VFSCMTNPSYGGADCSGDDDPKATDLQNTTPKMSAQGLVYAENATHIKIQNCEILGGGIGERT